MSGLKQHYIPQSLLRGFGKQGKGKSVQVTVYSRDRGVFTTATGGVAARRYFYSQLADGVGVETLDDRITAFETRLAKILVEFRGVVPGHTVDATKAAEVVTHLCARQAHLPLRAGAGRLNPIEEAELGPVEGLQVVHLQCHFGRDSLLSATSSSVSRSIHFDSKPDSLPPGTGDRHNLSGRPRRSWPR
jgi:hypothetical protein